MAQQKIKTSSSQKAVKSATKNSGKTRAKSSSKTGAKQGGKSNSSKNTRDLHKTQPEKNSLKQEIIMIMLIIISVIVLLSLCTSVMGIFGEFINSIFKGLMGISAFLLPLLVAAFSIWYLFVKERHFTGAKIAGIILFLISFAAFFHLITEKSGSFGEIGFFERISDFYTDATGVNGGVFGGITAYYLDKFFGWGSYIVLLALMVIAVMLSTGKSAVTGILNIADYFSQRKRVKEARIKAKAENIRIKEEKRAKKREIENAKYEEKTHKYKKGNFNITINGDEGLDSDLPALNAVVFEKKKEPEKEEKKEDIYDFCREVPEDDEEKGLRPSEKLIEVIGAINSEENDDKPEYDGTPAIFGVFDDMPDAAEKEPELNENNRLEENTESNEENNTENIEESSNDNLISVPFSQIGQNERAESRQEAEENKETEEISETAGNEFHEAQMEENEEGYEFSGDESMLEDSSPEEVKEALSETENELKQNTEQSNETEKESLQKEEKEIEKEAENKEVEKPKKEYVFPPIDLLGKEPVYTGGETKADMIENAKKLEDTLQSFGVSAKVIQVNKGPTVTRYELTPSQGVKVSKIVNLADDIALNLAATGIRIEAPIPGKAAVGIEVPNKETQSVYLRTVLESDAFKNAESKLTFVLGKDIAGNCVVTDIAKMPHLLIAGATGSGKSVCINTIITSIIYKAKPDEVKLLLVDPKVVELSVYNGIPHLLIPVVTDPKKAAGALNWAVKEMLLRYNTFAECHVRDIKGYNAMKKEKGETDFMPQIVIIIDELADLMMAAPNEVEDSICRLAQLARAAGMHLIIATQRPSVDVITGVIKANIPSRIAFAVSSGIDSRTILDCVGAEKLLGKGDMLFYPMGKIKPVRIQGAFVTDKEVENIVDFIKDGGEASYDSEVIDKITSAAPSGSDGDGEEKDEHFDEAVELVISKEKASVSMLQRQFRIGYNRAARIVEQMEKMGIVGPEEGSKPRKVLFSSFEEYKNRNQQSE